MCVDKNKVRNNECHIAMYSHFNLHTETIKIQEESHQTYNSGSGMAG